MWNKPKTNWKNGDFFNHIDYNRIVGNIDHIREMLDLEVLFSSKTVEEYMRVSEYNAITKAISEMYSSNNFNFELIEIPDRNDYSRPWNAEQLNLIESSIEKMYEELKGERTQIVSEDKNDNLASEDMNNRIFSE